MRILHFCMQAPFTEGYSYQDNLLTEYQHKHGHDVRIVTTTKTRGHDGKYQYTVPCKKQMDNGVELVRLDVRSRLRNAAGLYRGMMRQMKDYQPDLIFIHGLCSFIPSAAVRYKKRFAPAVRIVADNHQDAGTTRTDDLLSAGLMFLHRLNWKRRIRHVDKVYGTTSWRVTYAHEHYGIPYEKLDVLIMGVDADRLPSDKAGARSRLRAELSIPQQTFVWITGGKLDGQKHILEAMRAFSQIKTADAIFLVFGSVSEEIRRDFDDLLQSDDRIRYTGYLDSQIIHRYLISADFGIFPGRHSVLWEEAIGCGLPCLFRRYEERDHTEVCGNCICTDSPDTESIRRVMERLLRDGDYYRGLKQNAEKAARQFSYHTIAEKSVEVCKEEHHVRS